MTQSSVSKHILQCISPFCYTSFRWCVGFHYIFRFQTYIDTIFQNIGRIPCRFNEFHQFWPNRQFPYIFYKPSLFHCVFSPLKILYFHIPLIELFCIIICYIMYFEFPQQLLMATPIPAKNKPALISYLLLFIWFYRLIHSTK